MTPRRGASLCALLALSVGAPSLRNGFVGDDAYLIVGNAGIRSLARVPGFFAKPWGGGAGGEDRARVNRAYYRPLASTLMAIEYAVFGLRPWGWHATSLALHAAAVFLVALLIARVTRSPAAALVGASLFAVHPVHAEAVAAAHYQTTLLCGALVAAALLAFERVLEGPRPRRVTALAVAATAALLAKEEAVVLPLLAAAWAAVLRPPGWKRALCTGVVALAAAIALVLGVRAAVTEPTAVDYFEGVPRSAVALTMIRTAALYLELLVAPVRLCPFYDWFLVPVELSPSWAVLRGAGAVATVALAAAIALRRAPAATLGLGWLVLGLVPVLHFVPILNVAAERFLYLPFLGWATTVGVCLARIFELAGPRVRRAAMIGAVAAWALYAARSAVRYPDWRDDRALNRATARDFQTPTPLLNLAAIEEREGRLDEARAALKEAARRAPGWAVPRDQLRRLGAARGP